MKEEKRRKKLIWVESNLRSKKFVEKIGHKFAYAISLFSMMHLAWIRMFINVFKKYQCSSPLSRNNSIQILPYMLTA